MSTEHTAYYGVGYKVEPKERFGNDELLEVEYLYENLSDLYSSFRIGSDWSGDYSGTFVIVKEPFKDGLDLSDIKTGLDNELLRLSIQPCSDFGVVGGILVS